VPAPPARKINRLVVMATGCLGVRRADARPQATSSGWDCHG
jgi:hypothetical protein